MTTLSPVRTRRRLFHRAGMLRMGFRQLSTGIGACWMASGRAGRVHPFGNSERTPHHILLDKADGDQMESRDILAFDGNTGMSIFLTEQNRCAS